MNPRVRRRKTALRQALLAGLAGACLIGTTACGDVYVHPFRSGTCPVSSTPVGFAAPTGGGAGMVRVVTTVDQLEQAADTAGPLVIQISGMLTVSGQIDISSDKTVEGVGPASGLTGGGLRLKEVSNVILRNLVISKAVGQDAIELSTAVNVWVDHCDLSSDLDNGKSYYDGLVDIVHASERVTVSWTRFHDHFHSSLVGGSENNAAEDTGHLTVTFYANLFDNTQSQLPRVRFGKVHVLNNHFRNVALYAIASVTNAEVFVEGNVFENVAIPMRTNYEDTVGGAIRERDNLEDLASGPSEITTASTWSPLYDYADALLPAERVAQVVDTCAGTRRP